jgi:hypothetical protein
LKKKALALMEEKDVAEQLCASAAGFSGKPEVNAAAAVCPFWLNMLFFAVWFGLYGAFYGSAPGKVKAIAPQAGASATAGVLFGFYGAVSCLA